MILVSIILTQLTFRYIQFTNFMLRQFIFTDIPTSYNQFLDYFSHSFIKSG